MSEFSDMAARYVALDRRIETLKFVTTKREAALEDMERTLLSMMAAQGISNCDFKELGAKLQVRTDRYPRLKDKLRENELFEYLREKGHGEVIREQVNPQTLKATLRDLAKEEETLPDFLEVFEKPSISVRKLKK